MMAGDGHLDPEDPVLHRAAEAFGEYAVMCQELIDERKGRDDLTDLISILTNAHEEGALAAGGVADGVETMGELTNDELFMFLTLLVVAGNETTRNALSGGMLAFSLFPDQKDKLLANPELIDLAVDEIVRYVSPVISFNRTVTETHDYKGHRFEEGQKVLMLYQSANRDEDVFEAPDEFRIDRDPNPHLGFGIGTHFCLGANLARAEIRVVFTELFARLRDIRIAPGATLDRGDSTLVLALQHLPAVFTPVAPAAT
jgi:cytochrome P450 family 142 subfamily A polypeptide 1